MVNKLTSNNIINDFPYFLDLPVEIQSRIVFFATELEKGVLKKHSYTISNDYNKAIKGVYNWCLKETYSEENSLVIKVAYLCDYMSASEKHPLENFFDTNELKHPFFINKLYKQSLKTNNSKVFNYLLQHPNFTPDCFAYYWLLALNKNEEAEKIKSTIKIICDEDIWKEASKKGFYPIVEYFINIKNFDPSACDNYALRLAAEKGHVEVVKLLLQDKRVDPSALGNYAIKRGAEKGHTEIVKLFLQDTKVDPSAGNNYALRLAAEKGHTVVVKILMQDKRVDPSANDNYAIGLAAANGHDEVVKLLLQDKRVDPSDKNNYAIIWAAANGHFEVVKLLKQDERVSSSGYILAIKKAAENGHTNIVQLLSSK